MMRAARYLCSLILAAAIYGGVAASAWAEDPAQAVRPDDHTTGSAEAPLVMVEYASFACPHCAHFQLEAWPVIRDEFVETGLVQYVFRPMLTSPPQIAAIGMILADCAADDRYFSAVDLLFSEQTTIFEAAQAQGDVGAVYDRIAAAVGVSAEALNTCFNDPAMSEAVTAAARQANTDGIAGTPSFIIGGKVLSTTMTPEGSIFSWGGAPLLINGDRVPGQLDGDSFRRIILHFLERSDETSETAP